MEIKSALEIALERSEGVKADKNKIEMHKLKENGKKIASAYFKDPVDDNNAISGKLKEYSGKELQWVKEGVLSVLLAKITLPRDNEYDEILKSLEQGFKTVLKDHKKVSYIIKQLGQFFSQYLENIQNLEDNLKAQFAPRLKQKEQEISERIGSEFHLDPHQDPEFIKALQQNMNNLKDHFTGALADVKKEFSDMFNQ